MDKRWYSVAVSTLLFGCGGSAELGGDANNGSTGGTSSIDTGTPSATGGMPVAYYGVLVTGGTTVTIPTTGGAPGDCPATEPEQGSRCVGDLTCSYGGGVDCAFPCESGCTPVAADGSPLSSGLSAHSICLNGTWSLMVDGTCPTEADCQCGTAASPERIAKLTASCETSGGEVITAQCCTTTWDFAGTCKTAGACGCAPSYSRASLQCKCPRGCFDGTSCVSH